MEKLELKNTKTQRKSTVDGLSSRLGGTEERTRELTNVTTETRQGKPERNKPQRKNRASGTCTTTTKSHAGLSGVRKDRKMAGLKRYSKK